MRGEIFSLKPFTMGDQHGNTITYPSQSEADGALAVLLAFQHKGDAAAIDGDFRVSSLYRPKWDRADYRDATIKSAIAFYKKSEAIKEPPKQKQTAEAIVAETDDDEIVETEIQLPEFPEFTGTLADLCAAMSPDIPRAFKFTSALAHFGLIRSGLDTLAAEPHIQPRFYVSLIAEPGRGKTAAINEIGRIFKTVNAAYQAWPSIDSGPALVDAFDEQNRANLLRADGTDSLTDTPKILLVPDELKGLFEKAKITSGSRNTMLDETPEAVRGEHYGIARTRRQDQGAHRERPSRLCSGAPRRPATTACGLAQAAARTVCSPGSSLSELRTTRCPQCSESRTSSASTL